jgi:uncharacterized protein (TIGR03083 family)
VNTAIVEAVQRRSDELISAVRAQSDQHLALPARLPGWSRLTILCHLRFGATMTRRMTRATIDGQPTTFYPEGRATQRPTTLRPAPGESSQQVVESLAVQAAELADVWAGLGPNEWARPVVDSNDSGGLRRVPLTIGDLALLRLTEVEVHGTDLDVGLRDWSTEFVGAALPRRISWLGTRTQPNVDESADLPITWLLAATDGPAYLIRIDRNGQTTAEVATLDTTARHRIRGPSRELLAMILGRRVSQELRAPSAAISSFQQTFPGP